MEGIGDEGFGGTFSPNAGLEYFSERPAAVSGRRTAPKAADQQFDPRLERELGKLYDFIPPKAGDKPGDYEPLYDDLEAAAEGLADVRQSDDEPPDVPDRGEDVQVEAQAAGRRYAPWIPYSGVAGMRNIGAPEKVR